MNDKTILWIAIYLLFMQSCFGLGIHENEQDKKIHYLENEITSCRR